MRQNHFTAVVIGYNHTEIMLPYDKNLKCKPYVAMEFKDAKKYHERYIKYYEEMLKNDDLTPDLRELSEIQLQSLQEQDDIDFFLDTAYDLGYEIDEKTGNAVSTNNPNGKYDYCRVGKELSMPLINLEGNEVFSAKKKDIDWAKIHFNNTLPYEIAWETVMEGVEPFGEQQKQIYENMKNRTAYFKKFGTKENYIACSTVFWGYAYVDKNGWVELEDGIEQFEWVNNFYERFIEPLDDNEIITIYECVRN